MGFAVAAVAAVSAVVALVDVLAEAKAIEEGRVRVMVEDATADRL